MAFGAQFNKRLAAAEPATSRGAFLPFNGLCGRRTSRHAFRPSPDCKVIEPRAGAPEQFVNVRLRVDYFRYIDGPCWARLILPSGSTQFLPFPEAAALVDSRCASFLSNTR